MARIKRVLAYRGFTLLCILLIPFQGGYAQDSGETYDVSYNDDVEIELPSEPPVFVDGYIVQNCGCTVCNASTSLGSSAAPPLSPLAPTTLAALPPPTGSPSSYSTLLGVHTVDTVAEGERLFAEWLAAAESAPTQATAKELQIVEDVSLICMDSPQPQPPPAAPFRFIGRTDSHETIRPSLMPDGAGDMLMGEQLISKVCTESFPGCGGDGAIACSSRHRFALATAALYYYVKVEAICPDNPLEARYEVKDVYLYGPPENRHHIARTERGKNIVWQDIVENMNNPVTRAISQYLQNRPNGGRRLQYLYLKGQESLWHERQHEEHSKQFWAAYETIIDTPHYPETIALGCPDTRTPTAAVIDKILEDQRIRVGSLGSSFEVCTNTDFHNSVYQSGGYYSVLYNCACRGNGACEMATPALDLSATWAADSEACHLLYGSWNQPHFLTAPRSLPVSG